MLTCAGLAPGMGGGHNDTIANDTIAQIAKAAPDKDPAGYGRVRHASRIAGLPD